MTRPLVLLTLLLTTACVYDATSLQDLQCDNPGAQERGRICQDGIWVTTSVADASPDLSPDLETPDAPVDMPPQDMPIDTPPDLDMPVDVPPDLDMPVDTPPDLDMPIDMPIDVPVDMPIECGDGVVDAGEACDDGGTMPGDGCDGSCAIEQGYECPMPNAACVETCGDGEIVGAEVCDDGNQANKDGCDETCRIKDPGYLCRAPGVRCQRITSLTFTGSRDLGNIGTGGARQFTESCPPGYALQGIEGWGSRTRIARTRMQCATAAVGPGGLVEWVGGKSTGYRASAQSSKLAEPTCTSSAIAGYQGRETGGHARMVDATCAEFRVTNANIQVVANSQAGVYGYPNEGSASTPLRCNNNEIATAWYGKEDVELEQFGLDCSVVEIATCGDGQLLGKEECDDGNNTDGDGCDAECAPEAGFKCLGSPSACLSDRLINASLVFWIDPMQAGRDSGSISEQARDFTITDLSASGNDASTINTRFDPSGMGAGRPSYYTDGSNNSYVEFNNPNLGDFTAFVVFKSTDSRGSGNWYTASTLLGGDKNGGAVDAALTLNSGKIGFSCNVNGFGAQTSTSFNNGVVHVVTLQRARASGDFTIRVDGAVEASGSTGASTIAQPSKWYLSAHETVENGRLQAHYGDVMIFNTRLSMTAINELETYLQRKWKP